MQWRNELTIGSSGWLHSTEVTIIFPALYGVSGYQGDRNGSRNLRGNSGKGQDSLRAATISCFFLFSWCRSARYGSLPEQRTLRALQVSQVLASLRLVGASDISVGQFWFGNDGSTRLVGEADWSVAKIPTTVVFRSLLGPSLNRAHRH